VCTAERNAEIYTICPRRFEEQGAIEGVPRVLEDIALHYFGNFDNVVVFSEVRLPNVGTIDYVLVRHKPMRPQVEVFLPVELQSDSTTSTGGLIQGVRDFVDGHDLRERTYKFGMNTYDSIKRAITQLMNKGIVYEAWGTTCYWVIQEYIYANLVDRYGLKSDGFSPGDASRFALYNLVRRGGRLTLAPSRFVSTTVDEVYRAMRNNPRLPSKDSFVQTLDAKLQATLDIRFT
jgi:hypothetical protein